MRPAPQYDLGIPARDVAWVIWGSLLLMPVLFLGVVLSLGPRRAIDPEPPGTLVAVAIAAS
ncbi:MAG: hypothetical protein ACJ79R_00270, partial [Anaeromyxobacteraceae bacterium]